MKRRKFITSAGVGAAASTVSASALYDLNHQNSNERAIIEWRSYHMKWGFNSQLFMSHLKETLKPALLNSGASSVLIYKETSPETPTNVYVQIAHPSMSVYLKSLDISVSDEYMSATKEYDSQEASAFSRYTTSLIHAYTGMPQVDLPKEGYKYFEFRLYEGFNEDAVRRKNSMFNVEEIELFVDLGFHPLFFGEVVAGPYLPAMAYMMSYTDEADRSAKWKSFLESPRWIEMVNKPAYAKTVSNIRNVFLELV